MADPLKATKDAIRRKKQALQKEEEEREEWASMVPTLEDGIALLPANDPGLKEWTDSLADAKTSIALHDSILQKLRAELAALEAELPATAEPKFDPEKHPLLRKAVDTKEPEQVVTFATGDLVEAQWTDRAWYKAKIQSVLGSVSAPKYLVRFVEYDDAMTVDRSAVRPLPTKRKRDPEPAAASAPAAPVAHNPHVISGPASINPNAKLAKASAADDVDLMPSKKPKIANKGQLKKRQGAWQDFQAKAAKKMPKRESMFRTSNEAGSRVGFVGSGKGMTQTAKRTRHNFKADAQLDKEYVEELAEFHRQRY